MDFLKLPMSLLNTPHEEPRQRGMTTVTTSEIYNKTNLTPAWEAADTLVGMCLLINTSHAAFIKQTASSV